ncbi:ABC transporter permease [Roseivirga sp.]|uniref:ABC transporter permease n=1 Tax=Roseivirga sp. TaxID=1964215 RepID=UPI003B8CF2B5
MWRNYLKVALRNIRKNRVYTITNIIGLSSAMMGFIIVALYINYELSYDKFHNDVEDIKILKLKYSDKYGGRYNVFAPAVFADAIEKEAPGIDDVTTTSSGVGNLKVINAENQAISEQYYQFQNSFFDVFSFSAAYGSLEGALDDPKSVVISKKTALKYFNDENAVGKSLNIETQGEFVVKAVLNDFPDNSQFQPHIVIPLSVKHSLEALQSWDMNTYFVYLKTDGSTSDEELIARLETVYRKNVTEGGMYTGKIGLTAFTDSYWDWSESGASMNNRNKGLGANKDAMLICGVLAAILMIIALTNYVNMAVSRAIQRAKEVGIRKVNGALPRQLIAQFLTESIIFSLISLVVAIIVLELLMPSVSELMGVTLSINYLKPGQIVLLIGYAVLSGLFAGIYPAFFLSRFEPSKILKTRMMGNARSKTLFRVLLWFQFTLCAFLITIMSIMNGQLGHYFNYDLGFSKDQVVSIPFPNKNEAEAQRFLNQVNMNSGVLGTTVGPLPTGSAGANNVFFGDKKVRYADSFETNETFISTLEINLLQGRNIDPAISTDFSEGVIINELLANKLELEQAVGTLIQVEMYGQGKVNKRVLGVIEDVFLKGPSSPVRPLIILPTKKLITPRQNLLVRLDKDGMKEGLKSLEMAYASVYKNSVMTSSFLDDAYAMKYHRIQRLTTIINGVTTLIIAVSLFGLFAMIAFNITFRMREIGVRKVLGVSFFELQWTLSKRYIAVITLSLLTAIPAAYFLMDNILNAFFNRLPLTISHGAYAGLGIYLLAILIVLAKGLSTIKLNPVNILRND